MELSLKHRMVALLVLLIVANTTIHLVWLVQDHGPLPIQDGYIYLTQLLHVIDGLPPSSLQEAWSAIEGLSVGGRPPLYPLLTIPSILLFGRSVAAACTINLIFIPLLLIFTFRYADSISGGRAGLLAAFLVSTYPPIVHLTRNYMPYSVLPALGVLFLWLLAELQRHRSAKLAWLLGAALACGLMIHPQFLRFTAIPTLLFGLYTWLFPKEPGFSWSREGATAWLKARFTDRLFLRGLLPAALMVIATVLPWYLTVGYRLLNLTQTLGADAIEDYRGKAVLTIGFQSTEPSFWFLRTAPGTLSWVLALMVVVGVLFGILKGRASTWILIVSLVSTYAILDNLSQRAWWTISVILPVAAILTSLWVTEIRPRWLSLSLTALCVTIGMFNFSVVTWGLSPSLEPVAAFLGAPLGSGTCKRREALPLCPAPARPASEFQAESDAVKVIFEDSKCQAKTCQLLKVSGSMSWLHLRYFVASQYPGRTLNVAGPRSPNFARPYGINDLLRSQYLLYPAGTRVGKNLYATATLEFLAAPPQAFSDAHQKVGLYGRPGHLSLTLLKRIAPLSALEAEASIAVLNLDEKYLGEKFLTLSALYRSEANVEAMMRLYEEAQDFPVSSAVEKKLRRALMATGQRKKKLLENQEAQRSNSTR